MRAATVRRSSSSVRLRAFQGGLLLISGPALEGKGALAAALAERLPDAVLIGGPDDLGGDRIEERVVLESALEAWRARRSPATTIIAVGRFPTRVMRRDAARRAREERMAFLLVECTSSAIRSLRQVSRLFLPTQEAVARMQRYEDARRRYVGVDDDERRTLPAMCVRRVLANVEDAAERVALAWART